jgi:DNA-directed RNA polymerase subunit M/transcription elongation factor TFIIS
MNKSEEIRCAKRGHILSQDEIDKGICNKCRAIEAGIIPEEEIVYSENKNKTNLDKKIDEIIDEYQEKNPLKPVETNQYKHTGCLIIPIVLLILLISSGIYIVFIQQ